MTALVRAALALVVVSVGPGLAAARGPSTRDPQKAPRLAASHTPSMSPEAQNAVINTYCLGCHDDDGRAGGLTLQDFNPARAEREPETAEKIIRKLRAGMMPPPVAKERPDRATALALVTSLEGRLDEAAAANPNPGWRPFQRLNRAEYANAVRDLLGIDVDVSAYLPADTVSAGFDNVADTQSLSPTLLEGYLRAASQISRLAVGDRSATPASVTYKIPENESQMRHVEGTPFGTRGGVSLVHIFPADGEYVVRVELHRTSTGELFGNTTLSISGRDEPVDVAVNDERAAVVEVDPHMSEADANGLTLETAPIRIQAGPQRISAAFPDRFVGPVDDLMAPIEHSLADSRIGTGFGITTLPHLQAITITGPYHVTGVSDTPSRRRIFTCHPADANQERACAAQIVKRLSARAYRGESGASSLELLMRLYDQGRQEGGFETGVRLALQGILANPRFLFRVEDAPASASAGGGYRIDDLDLASRLSFFVWGTVPDPELVAAARRGTLGRADVLDRQVRRMLADPRAEALSTRFAAQWLRLQDVDKLRPDSLLYPNWDLSLSDAFKRETELFFDSIVREDRSVLDLVTADYSFVNGRLARHYGIPDVTGDQFRRVTLPSSRRGILGQGSMLLLTSVADRTSPVQRGKWLLEVLFGAPPPPPPPNVPALDATSAVSASGRPLSVRERMEEHRKNPACASCHRVIDPLGLALENFDPTGAWRLKDNGVPVDATGVLWDGTAIDGPAGLRRAILNHSDVFLRAFTESLMTYALGRRVEYYDMPTVRTIVRDAAARDNHFSSFVLGIVNSAAFRMMKPQAATTEQAGR
jgi:mono/diheme cytochrome c family protein